MKRRKYSALLVMALMVVFLAVACSENKTDNPPAGGAASPAPATGASPAPAASPGGTEVAKSGEPVTAEKAQQLYQTRCVPCHGADGKGRKEVAPKSPDFSDPEWQKKKTDEDLAKAINDGIGTGKGAMPRWKNLLSQEEVNGLVAHVRVLGKK